MKNIIRGKNIAEKVVFVDGFPGCGKTLFSMLISTMGRVELLSYAYEIEHMCQLFYLGKITTDAAAAMVSVQTDLRAYNAMMGRNVNFRPSDLSSAIKYHNPSKYFQRIFQEGDESVLEAIKKEDPILNFSVHNMLSHSAPIWDALKERCVFIEVVRHPLYMFRQEALNMERLIGNARHFSMYYENNGHEFVYYVKGWEENYIKSNDVDRAIYFMDNSIKRTNRVRNELVNKYGNNILTIPFEKFVLSPDSWIDQISKTIGTNVTNATRKVMKEQNVPRDRVAQGIDIDIYSRCGWVPPADNTTERDELNIRREDAARKGSNDALIVLDRISKEYEDKYWNPDFCK